MIDFVRTLATVIVLFGATVFVHELGHFLVARWCGMVVETFSIGFGPALWKRKIGDVVYKIGALPFGGYVALPQMDPEGGSQADDGDEADRTPLPPVSPWKRIAVSLAGATFNLLFAFLIAVVVFRAAGSADVAGGRLPVVGTVEEDSEAYAMGLRAGDRILSVNGRSIRSWDDLIIDGALAEEVRLAVRAPDGAERELTLPTHPLPGGGRIIPGIGRRSPCLIIGTSAGSPAETAGLLRGDLVVAVAGEPVYSVEQLIESIRSHRDQSVELEILRESETQVVSVRPVWNEAYQRAMIGIEFNRFDLSMRPAEQMWAWASPVFRILKALVSPKESKHAAAAVGGPVYIFKMYWMAAQTGFLLALWLTGLLNVNLAILNLLPIPVLDGGHVMFSLWEGLTRRPVSVRAIGWAHRIFAALLISLFLLITLRDVRRLVSDPSDAGKAAKTSAEPAASTP